MRPRLTTNRMWTCSSSFRLFASSVRWSSCNRSCFESPNSINIAFADWNKRSRCSRANCMRPFTARMPSCILVSFEQAVCQRELYPYAVTNEEVRIKDRYNSLVSRHKSELAAETISNSNLLSISIFFRRKQTQMIAPHLNIRVSRICNDRVSTSLILLLVYHCSFRLV